MTLPFRKPRIANFENELSEAAHWEGERPSFENLPDAA